MKIYFEASVTGRKLYLENYKKIYQKLQESGNEIYTHAFESSEEKIAQETPEEAESFFMRMEKALNKSDIAFFEVSYPSLGIGYEVGYFLNLGRPVIALHVPGRNPYVLESIKNEKLLIQEYDPNQLDDSIDQLLELAEDLVDVRFTMIMPSRLNRFLDEVNRTRGVSRSEFIRDLIEKEINKK